MLEKALAAVRAQLAEAAKPVEAKRLLVESAAKTLELTKSEKAKAEKVEKSEEQRALEAQAEGEARQEEMA